MNHPATNIHPMVGPGNLSHQVVKGFNADMARFIHEHTSIVTYRYTLELRNNDLNDKPDIVAMARDELAKEEALKQVQAKVAARVESTTQATAAPSY